jgi:LuxR family transcriptional regulator, maltose regulon positive regulatory protein
MNDGKQAFNDSLAAYDALTRGAWAEAGEAFKTLLGAKKTPETLEGLSTAAWGLGDMAGSFAAREEAYQLYRQAHDHCGAARVAARLALDYFYFRGDAAVANGWLKRGHRLLGEQERCLERGWLAVTEAQIIVWTKHDFVTARELCALATDIGKSLGDADLETLALACEGLCLVGQGLIGEGMSCLDEATLAAVTGDIKDVDATCTTCCCLIFACEWTRDFERARQWLERLKGIAVPWAHPTQVYFCRIHYAGLLVWQGAWQEAEAEFKAAISGLEHTQPALAAEALVRLTDLYCRQGHADAALEMLKRASSPPFQALAGDFCLLGRAALALVQQDAEAASDFLERFLRRLPKENYMERVGALELLIQAQSILGNSEGAEATLAELRAVVSGISTNPMRAALHFSEGIVANLTGDYERAKRCFEDATQLWQRSGVPFEGALSRLKLAQTVLLLGKPQLALQQAGEALAVLKELGAQPFVTQAKHLIQKVESALATHETSKGLMTLREIEVLRLIAEGKSNQEIAASLGLSIRTVERHISNIYIKLSTGGKVARATATAYAFQHGLISSPPQT